MSQPLFPPLLPKTLPLPVLPRNAHGCVHTSTHSTTWDLPPPIHARAPVIQDHHQFRPDVLISTWDAGAQPGEQRRAGRHGLETSADRGVFAAKGSRAGASPGVEEGGGGTCDR